MLTLIGRRKRSLDGGTRLRHDELWLQGFRFQCWIVLMHRGVGLLASASQLRCGRSTLPGPFTVEHDMVTLSVYSGHFCKSLEPVM